MYKLLIIMMVLSSTALAEQVVWRLVWPNGYMLSTEFTNLTICQSYLRSSPSGSNCIATVKR